MLKLMAVFALQTVLFRGLIIVIWGGVAPGIGLTSR